MIGSGTVIAMRWLSGSSLGMSLFGHQTLAPSPSLVVEKNGRLRLSTPHPYPPSHGGRTATRGAPWYQIVSVFVAPFACGASSVTYQALPARVTVSAPDPRPP